MNRRHREIELHDAVVVQGRDDVTRLDECAHTDIAQADNTGKRCDDQAILQLGFDGPESGLGGFVLPPPLVEQRCGCRPALDQGAQPIILFFGFGNRRAFFFDQGMLLFVGHFDQDTAGFHPLAVFEMDVGHDFGNRRGQLDGFVGAQRSKGLHTVDEAIDRYLL